MPSSIRRKNDPLSPPHRMRTPCVADCQLDIRRVGRRVPAPRCSLAGHYYMRGMMEVGSELQLKANGEFEYMLAYGALDEYATGAGRARDMVVTLVATKFEANAEDQ